MQTTIGVNDPKAVRAWATSLAKDVAGESYWTKFVGKGENNIIENKVDLEGVAGDTVQFDLLMRLRTQMVTGDNRVEGTAAPLKFHSDEIKIDQARFGASAGGRMTRKRTLHNLRKISRQLATEFAAQWIDEGIYAYVGSDEGLTAINEDRVFAETNFAGNPITSPDSAHQVYGGAATSKATLTADDKMTYKLIERVSVIPEMMNSTNTNAVRMSPVKVGDGKHYVLLMNPFQAHDLRTEVGDLSWSKIAQARTMAEGAKSPIFKGGIGMINNVVMHEHQGVLRWGNAGVGGNVAMARALLLGRQAGIVAYGSAGNGARMTWVEKLTDADNQVDIYCGVIMGMRKTRFNGLDFGVVAVDTASRDPNKV